MGASEAPAHVVAKGIASFSHAELTAGEWCWVVAEVYITTAPDMARALLRRLAMSNTKVSSSSTHGTTTSSSSMMESAKERVGHATEVAAEKFDEATSSVGGTMHRAAERLGGAGEPGVRGRASEKLEEAGNYLSTADYDAMVNDVTEVIRQNPVPAVLVAAGLGFAIGRLVS